MKRIFLFILCGFILSIGAKALAEPDSVYLFAYTKVQDEGRSGLMFAWSRDKDEWHSIGNGFAFLYSDYSRWGSEKRMIAPFLFKGENNIWQCIWQLGPVSEAIAYTYSSDLLSWYPQTYEVNDFDLKTFSTQKIKEERGKRQKAFIQNEYETGTINKVSWETVNALIQKTEVVQYRNRLWGETTKEDAVRFADLKSVSVSLTPQISKTKKISDMLMGVFFEDINYAADGGIYAELIQNRDFEYDPADKENRDPSWNSKTAWNIIGNGLEFDIQTDNPIHANNAHYAVLKVRQQGGKLVNEGFDGIVIRSGDKYNFSLFGKILEGKNNGVSTRLVDENGNVIATSVIKNLSSKWKKYDLVLTAKSSSEKAKLEIIPVNQGSIALDMISLFPQKTFMGRKNGLCPDLAQTIADLHPKFVRFPGGCVAHGDGLENIYNWKNTIGPLEARKPQRNLWGYHQSAGLGYYEYFQFCEDIGAAPVPIVAAGVSCQNSAPHGHPLGGQQCGIPMEDMGDYIQDVLDLVEWANGDATTKWGKIRAASGHPKPFNLKYIGVGNEDLISDVFTERFTMIYEALKEKHPEITVIGTVGPFFEGSDYNHGWEVARELKVPIVDEHYYVQPGWMIYNQDFYDKYDRNGPKVYLGEYAAHLPGRPNNLETALAEAIHLTTLERNGDVVEMSSYAPLLAKEGHTQWNPDLIYFNNSEVKPTTGYYVQQLFGMNSGDEYIPVQASFSDWNEKVTNRIAFSIVRDSKTQDLILKFVNLLPVSFSADIDLSDFNLDFKYVEKSVMTGNPADRNLKPVVEKTEISPDGKFELPGYSFSVFRVRGR